jgi:hypothetical protein
VFNWSIDEAVFSQTRTDYKTKTGVLIEVDLELLTEAVYLFPKADQAFRERVQSLLRKHRPGAQVIESELGSRPRT